MSRSWKKNAYAGDHKGKGKKRVANSKVRMYLKNLDNILQNSDYKKIYETWDICDYGALYTWKQYWEHTLYSWYKWGHKYYPFPDEKEEYREWYTTYKMK